MARSAEQSSLPVLRRADALRNVLIPISTVFAGDTDAYIAGLTHDRADPPALDEWVIGFAHAVERAAGNAVRLAEGMVALDRDVYDTFAADPVLTAESVSARLAVSPAAARAFRATSARLAVSRRA